jgi:small-conductance mechanosensitive channel
MTNLTQFSQFIYFTPLHVSSNKCSSSGGSNCVKIDLYKTNTSTIHHNTTSYITRAIYTLWILILFITKFFKTHVCNFRQSTYFQSVLYQMMCWHTLILLMMSTCCWKRVEAWNKYIEKSASSWSLTRIAATRFRSAADALTWPSTCCDLFGR